MSRDSADIGWIVAEVIRRLQAPDVGTSAHRAEASAASAPPADACVVEDRLVTLATLPPDWHTHSTLMVPRGAVITPAVKDELRNHGVSVATQVTAAVPATTAGVEVIVAVCDAVAERVTRTFAPLVNLPATTASDLAAAVREAGTRVRDPHRVVVLLTDQPLAAVCLANRNPNIRAATGTTSADAKAAVTAIGANVWVTDPRHLTSAQWQNIVAQLQDNLPRRCPLLLSESRANLQTP